MGSLSRPRLVALGAGVALALALPAALLAQVLEAVRRDGAGSAVTYVAALVVLAAMVLGGAAAGRHRPDRAALVGAAAGFLAIAVILAVGITRRLVAREDVAWGTVPATALLATALASTSSALSAHRTGRKRP